MEAVSVSTWLLEITYNEVFRVWVANQNRMDVETAKST